MRISIVANGIVDFRHPARGERYIRDAGFEQTALSMAPMFYKKPLVPSVSFPSPIVLAPSARICEGTPVPAGPDELLSAAKQALSVRGIRYFCTDAADTEWIARLVDVFRDTEIKVLLMNGSRVYQGRFMKGRFADSREAGEVIRRFGRDRVGFCLHVGQANLSRQDLSEMIPSFSGLLDAVIVCDNDGFHDSSYIPFTSSVDWGAFFRGMRKIRYDGELVMDSRSSTASAPLSFKDEKVRESRRIADYLCWQIGMERMIAGYPKRVLFGAGNMCRNYMRDYGAQYPPLFTTDNDPKMWGKVFEGLLVKPPEALKELDPDTAVLVCITYYEEIHRQLEEMGVTNPVEDFSDEYPNTKGERLEREWSE